MQDNILRGEIVAVPNEEQHLGEIFYKSLCNADNPDNILLLDYLTKQSYNIRDVFRRSIQAANRLYTLGVRQGDVVSIVSANRIDYLFAVLGCFYLGAPVNPLNPDYIEREIKHAFDITRPKFAIASPEKLPEVQRVQAQVDYIEAVICLPNLSDTIGDDELAAERKATNIDPKEAVAVILCSSGTTGFPKGVALTHQSIKQCFMHVHVDDGFGIQSQETLLAMLPFYHILGFIIITTCILFGAKAIFLSKFKPQLFLETIQTHRISKLFVVPPLALYLAKSPQTADYDLSSVVDIICGAAPLGHETQAALEQKLGVCVRQAYGLTEACAATLTPRSPPHYPGSAGRILANVEAKFISVDGTQRALGLGEVGEVCLRSPCLMKGYMNNTAATRDSFDADGFLRTGDLGYCNEDGFVFIVDRLKELIKYKGFQVPPAELEDVLMTHAGVRDAAVVGVPDERAGELARAYVVRAEGANVTADEIKEYIALHVSVQKQLHGGVVFIDAIPKSDSGKILRRELRKLATSPEQAS